MVKKHLAFLLLAVVCVSFVSAIDTKIDVKTVPNYEVQVSVSKANSVAFVELGRSKVTSNQYGDTSFLFHINDSKYNLAVFIKKDGEKILEKRDIDLISGEYLYLELLPEWATLIETPKENLSTNLSEETNVSIGENQTLENQTGQNLVEQNESKGNFISSTGLFIIEKGKKIFSSNMTYYVIAIFAIGVFAFAIRRKFTGAREPREIKVRKLSELREAERRLKEAEEEVSKLRNTDKIQELEEEIRKLKGED